MGKGLYQHLICRIHDAGDKVFIASEVGDYLYSDIDENAAKIQQVMMGVGVSKGSRVLVQVNKSPEAVMLYLACLRMGAIFVPLNTGYKQDEVEYFYGNAEPDLCVCEQETKDRFTCAKTVMAIDDLWQMARQQSGDVEITDLDGDDIAAILYTSGTTGRSKGAMLSNDNLRSNVEVLSEYWQWSEDDVLLHILPIFHVHGLFVALHCALWTTNTVIFHNGYNPDNVIADLPKSTVMMGVPTHYVRLLENEKFGRDVCKNMRLFLSGSAPLLTETFHEFEKVSGIKILERYGMTEAGMITSNPYDGDRVAGTVGFPLPDVDARLGNIKDGKGVLEIKGPNVFKGYWRMPEKTAEEFTDDGYFITGDISIMDDEGRVSIVGRAKDLIITGGLNVYPKEIESLIDDMDGVKESAVIGVSHPDFGEGVTAIVVPDGSVEISEDIIINDTSEKLASFKVPKRIYIVDELPRNTMGKVQKNALREEYAKIYGKEK
ncbi:AMP-binding protein [Pseudemcibacter aquimaris]|uniref:AMP-binding protein n=1 Tax=Pseudemcibacter aquimaris TaxID=2857064 RepID=UPI0020134B2B|nr:AMP-binding protein [Pseudemcibacter aquimaris]MCC3860776.1 AMP-binding protein [Pseudemcibacter aquimaris]WDU59596.1 AMP-binding protein [Pseudemcibacter aquimaris]